MVNQIMLYILYAMTLSGTILSFYICYKKQNVSSYTFCGTILTIFVLTTLSTAPVTNKITTPGISIEPRIESIEKKQEEQKEIVTALSGMIANLYSTTWKTEPLSPSRQKKIESHINSITKYLSQESREELKNGLDRMPIIFSSEDEPPKENLLKGDLWISPTKIKK